MYNILVVDDDEDIVELLRYNLVKEGFNVFTANNGEKAIAQANAFNPHLILMDIMMPVMDGVEACRILRNSKNFANTIIVFLSARVEDYSQLAAYDAGADDYVIKPIKFKILLSKISVLLKRNNGDAQAANTVFTAGKFTIDREKYLIINENGSHDLPRKEFELMALLASKTNKVFTRDEILSKVWGSDVVVGDRTIDVHIRKLRERFGNETIKTIKGVGYKLEL